MIGQVVAANVLLVTVTLFAASLAAGLDITIKQQRWQFAVLALAIVLTLCVNLWMLRRRFKPLEHLIERVERVDPAEPATFELAGPPMAEIERLSESFRLLLKRLEAERQKSGKLVLRAQEEERRRVARDLHDEVNQALTAILLRLEALGQETPERAAEVTELKRLANQAMDELISLARSLRPTALDDHGLVAAIDAQLKLFSARTGVETRFETRGKVKELDEDSETAIYRVAQEALANAGRHANATCVEVGLVANGDSVELRIRDDGRGFDPGVRGTGTGLGLGGMAERARLVGGELDVRSAPGSGTSLTLRIP
jgi:two-component system, NarL family, sensor histidine kinase UhpB